MAHTLNAQDYISIAREYYAAIDAKDADRVASTYIPTATLKFNADDPIVSKDAIREFSEQFFSVVTTIEHTRVEVWTKPLLGSIRPTDVGEPMSEAAVTIVSTACPIFTIGAVSLPIPATSIFSIDQSSGLFVSVHNMFDLDKTFAAVSQ